MITSVLNYFEELCCCCRLYTRPHLIDWYFVTVDIFDDPRHPQLPHERGLAFQFSATASFCSRATFEHRRAELRARGREGKWRGEKEKSVWKCIGVGACADSYRLHSVFRAAVQPVHTALLSALNSSSSSPGVFQNLLRDGVRTEKTTTTAIETPIVTLRSVAAAKGGGLKTERILDVLDGQFAAIVV